MRAAIATSLLAFTGPALASPVVVLNDGEHKETIVSRNGYYIHLFANEVTLDPFDPVHFPQPNTIRINFEYGLQLYGAISGNTLADWPPLPVPTPSLLAEGGLKVEGEQIDASRDFAEPQHDPTSGGTGIAQLTHGAGSDFDLTEFTIAGDMAYIGYATSDLSVFGYMQIERVTEVDWKLVGYAFDPSGDAILVRNLVPAPGALAAFGLVLAIPRSRRR